MAFYVVYIQEAHASDVWQLPSNIKDNVVFRTPRSFDERGALAGSCVRKLNIEIPAVVDEFGNPAGSAYTAWPDRLYVIGKDGRIAHKSKPGPFGFNPSGVDAVLRAL